MILTNSTALETCLKCTVLYTKKQNIIKSLFFLRVHAIVIHKMLKI